MIQRTNKTTKKSRHGTGGAAIDGVSPMLLGNCSHLAALATADLVRLSASASCRMVFEGETVFRQGDPAGPVYLLLDGALELRHAEEPGLASGYDEELPYATFGDMTLLGEERRRYTVTASRDSVVLELPLESVIEVLQKNDAAALAWRGSIMARLHRKEPALATTFSWRILGKLANVFQAA